MSAPEMILCALGLIATAVLLAGAICYAHCRGDAAMGVADTQGRDCTWPACDQWACPQCKRRWPAGDEANLEDRKTGKQETP